MCFSWNNASIITTFCYFLYHICCLLLLDFKDLILLLHLLVDVILTKMDGNGENKNDHEQKGQLKFGSAWQYLENRETARQNEVEEEGVKSDKPFHVVSRRYNAIDDISQKTTTDNSKEYELSSDSYGETNDSQQLPTSVRTCSVVDEEVKAIRSSTNFGNVFMHGATDTKLNATDRITTKDQTLSGSGTPIPMSCLGVATNRTVVYFVKQLTMTQNRGLYSVLIELHERCRVEKRQLIMTYISGVKAMTLHIEVVKLFNIDKFYVTKHIHDKRRIERRNAATTACKRSTSYKPGAAVSMLQKQSVIDTEHPRCSETTETMIDQVNTIKRTTECEHIVVSTSKVIQIVSNDDQTDCVEFIGYVLRILRDIYCPETEVEDDVSPSRVPYVEETGQRTFGKEVMLSQINKKTYKTKDYNSNININTTFTRCSHWVDYIQFFFTDCSKERTPMYQYKEGYISPSRSQWKPTIKCGGECTIICRNEEDKMTSEQLIYIVYRITVKVQSRGVTMASAELHMYWVTLNNVNDGVRSHHTYEIKSNNYLFDINTVIPVQSDSRDCIFITTALNLLSDAVKTSQRIEADHTGRSTIVVGKCRATFVNDIGSEFNRDYFDRPGIRSPGQSYPSSDEPNIPAHTVMDRKLIPYQADGQNQNYVGGGMTRFNRKCCSSVHYTCMYRLRHTDTETLQPRCIQGSRNLTIKVEVMTAYGHTVITTNVTKTLCNNSRMASNESNEAVLLKHGDAQRIEVNLNDASHAADEPYTEVINQMKVLNECQPTPFNSTSYPTKVVFDHQLTINTEQIRSHILLNTHNETDAIPNDFVRSQQALAMIRNYWSVEYKEIYFLLTSKQWQPVVEGERVCPCICRKKDTYVNTRTEWSDGTTIDVIAFEMLQKCVIIATDQQNSDANHVFTDGNKTVNNMQFGINTVNRTQLINGTAICVTIRKTLIRTKMQLSCYEDVTSTRSEIHQIRQRTLTSEIGTSSVTFTSMNENGVQPKHVSVENCVKANNILLFHVVQNMDDVSQGMSKPRHATNLSAYVAMLDPLHSDSVNCAINATRSCDTNIELEFTFMTTFVDGVLETMRKLDYKWRPSSVDIVQTRSNHATCNVVDKCEVDRSHSVADDFSVAPAPSMIYNHSQTSHDKSCGSMLPKLLDAQFCEAKQNNLLHTTHTPHVIESDAIAVDLGNKEQCGPEKLHFCKVKVDDQYVLSIEQRCPGQQLLDRTNDNATSIVCASTNYNRQKRSIGEGIGIFEIKDSYVSNTKKQLKPLVEDGCMCTMVCRNDKVLPYGGKKANLKEGCTVNRNPVGTENSCAVITILEHYKYAENVVDAPIHLTPMLQQHNDMRDQSVPNKTQLRRKHMTRNVRKMNDILPIVIPFSESSVTQPNCNDDQWDSSDYNGDMLSKLRDAQSFLVNQNGVEHTVYMYNVVLSLEMELRVGKEDQPKQTNALINHFTFHFRPPSAYDMRFAHQSVDQNTDNAISSAFHSFRYSQIDILNAENIKDDISTSSKQLTYVVEIAVIRVCAMVKTSFYNRMTTVEQTSVASRAKFGNLKMFFEGITSKTTDCQYVCTCQFQTVNGLSQGVDKEKNTSGPIIEHSCIVGDTTDKNHVEENSLWKLVVNIDKGTLIVANYWDQDMTMNIHLPCFEENVTGVNKMFEHSLMDVTHILESVSRLHESNNSKTPCDPSFDVQKSIQKVNEFTVNINSYVSNTETIMGYSSRYNVQMSRNEVYILCLMHLDCTFDVVISLGGRETFLEHRLDIQKRVITHVDIFNGNVDIQLPVVIRRMNGETRSSLERSQCVKSETEHLTKQLATVSNDPEVEINICKKHSMIKHEWYVTMNMDMVETGKQREQTYGTFENEHVRNHEKLFSMFKNFAVLKVGSLPQVKTQTINNLTVYGSQKTIICASEVEQSSQEPVTSSLRNSVNTVIHYFDRSEIRRTCTSWIDDKGIQNELDAASSITKPLFNETRTYQNDVATIHVEAFQIESIEKCDKSSKTADVRCSLGNGYDKEHSVWTPIVDVNNSANDLGLNYDLYSVSEKTYEKHTNENVCSIKGLACALVNKSLVQTIHGLEVKEKLKLTSIDQSNTCWKDDTSTHLEERRYVSKCAKACKCMNMCYGEKTLSPTWLFEFRPEHNVAIHVYPVWQSFTPMNVEEWNRFISYNGYGGHGNAFHLARNGFFHDAQSGPTSTICYFCHARRDNWQPGDTDNIEAHHHRGCPLYRGTSNNIPIHSNNLIDTPINERANTQHGAGGTDSLNTQNRSTGRPASNTDERSDNQGGNCYDGLPTPNLYTRRRANIPYRRPIRGPIVDLRDQTVYLDGSDRDFRPTGRRYEPIVDLRRRIIDLGGANERREVRRLYPNMRHQARTARDSTTRHEDRSLLDRLQRIVNNASSARQVSDNCQVIPGVTCREGLERTEVEQQHTDARVCQHCRIRPAVEQPCGHIVCCKECEIRMRICPHC